MMRYLILILSVLLSACAKLPDSDQYADPLVAEPGSLNSKILSDYSEASSIMPQESVIYQVDLESKDFVGLPQRVLDLDMSSVPFSVALNEIAHQLNVGILNDASKEANAREISGVKMVAPVAEILPALEKYANVDIFYRNKTLYVADRMTIQGSFSHLESQGVEALASLKKHLEKVLGKNSEVLIDNLTGAFSIASDPNTLRKSRGIVENMINEATAYSLLRLNIYKINNNRVREFGVTVEALVDDVMKLSAGAVPGNANSTLKTLLSHVKESTTGEDGSTIMTKGIKANLEALEEAGIMHSVASPTLMLFNGIKSELSNLRKVGAWVPGEVQQQNQFQDGGGNVAVYTEGRPTFEEEEVGTRLRLLPRVDLSNKRVHLNILYSESNIYAETQTTWNRTINDDTNVITLSKPLKQEAKIRTRVILEDGLYQVVSGSKQKEVNLSGSGLPGSEYTGGTLGKESGKTQISDTLIVARAYFPQFYRVHTVGKME